MRREYGSNKLPEEIKARLRERTRPYHFVIWADPNVWLLIERKDGTVRIVEETTAKYFVAANLQIVSAGQGSHITVDMESHWLFWRWFGVMMPIVLLCIAVREKIILGAVLGILLGLYFGSYIPSRAKKKEKELLALIERVIKE